MSDVLICYPVDKRIMTNVPNFVRNINLCVSISMSGLLSGGVLFSH